MGVILVLGVGFVLREMGTSDKMRKMGCPGERAGALSPHPIRDPLHPCWGPAPPPAAEPRGGSRNWAVERGRGSCPRADPRLSAGDPHMPPRHQQEPPLTAASPPRGVGDTVPPPSATERAAATGPGNR